MDSTVNATAIELRVVGGIDDSIDIERRNIGLKYFYHGYSIILMETS